MIRSLEFLRKSSADYLKQDCQPDGLFDPDHPTFKHLLEDLEKYYGGYSQLQSGRLVIVDGRL